MNFSVIWHSPSKTLACVLVFFCLGILLGPFVLGLQSIPLLLTGFGFVFIGFFSSRRYRLLMILIAVFLFGMFRYQQSIVPSYLTTIADRTGMSVRLEGIVNSDVERRIGTQQAILSKVRVADENVFGKLLVRFPLTPKISYGDSVAFTCKLDLPEPFNGFAYDRQLAARGVLAICFFPQFTSVTSPSSANLISNILWIRDYLIQQLQRVFHEPHASFISGLLFGGSSSFSSDMKEDFSNTGTTHILAASGFNISIFSLLLLRWLLQSPLGRRRGLIMTFVLLCCYVIAAGATASIVRAGVMASLLLVQTAIGRKALMTNVLLLTLSVMLLINPRLLLDDVGFQLSFTATAGLLFILPLIEHRFSFLPEFFGLRMAFASSCVAIVFTFPILLWHFGQISITAPLVNTLILPLIPFLMSFGALTILSSLISLPLGHLLAIPATGLSYAILRLITIFGSLPIATLSTPYAKPVAILVGGVIILITFWILCLAPPLSSLRSERQKY